MADLNVNSLANAAGTGACAGVTAAANDNSTAIATTAFVKAQNYQSSLGFTPVQQGGGIGQSTANKIYLGWTGSALKAQVDTSDQGDLVTSINILNSGSYGFGTRSLGGTGYQKLPGGMIIQYATTVVNFDANGLVTVTLPTAFPNNFFTITATNGDYNIAPDRMLNANFNGTLTQFQARIYPGIQTTYRLNYIAIGN